MNLVIIPAAIAELEEAARRYSATANAQLGLAFVAEFEHALSLILSNPHFGAVFRGDRRRLLLRRFPYGVIYQLKAEEVRIVAVAHRRRPGYWAKRK